MKKVLSVFFALVAVVALVACKPDPKTGDGYGLVHNHYVGHATLTVNGDGVVTEAKFDEYYLPYTFANLAGQSTVHFDTTKTGVGYGLVHNHYVGKTALTADANGTVLTAAIDEYYLPYNLADITAQTPSAGSDVIVAGSKTFAKYFKVGNLLFTGALAPEATVPTYSATDIADIEVWVKTPANAKLYAEACDNGSVFIANADGTKHATYVTQYAFTLELTGVAQYLKSTTNYGGTRWNWGDAMDKLEALYIDSKMNLDMSQATLNADDGFWHVGPVVTDSTLVDFKDYYNVALTAYAELKAANSDVVTIGTSTWAKYVKVGDLLFTGSVAQGATAPTYSATNIADIEVWVKTPANAKTFAHACDTGKVFIANADGTAHASYKTQYAFSLNLSGVNQFLKSTTNYGGTRWDWGDAMAKLKALFVDSKMELDMADAVLADDGFWHVGDVVTDSTLVDFKDYYTVALTAYNAARGN